MTRWNAGLVATAVVAAGLAGCRQQCFMTEADYHATRENPYVLPANLESDPHQAIIPTPGHTPAPTTVIDLNRPARYMSLAEAIAISLEQGNIGSQSPLFPGIANDGLVAFNGRLVAGSDAVRVLALDPAIIAADIESSLARFDARWISSASWNKADNAVANALTNLQNGDNASLSTGVYKPLPTGGLAGITYNLNYQLLNAPPTNFSVINPSYRPQVQLVFEQPLLQSFGVEINQLTSNTFVSQIVPGFRPAGGNRTEGILITRLRFDQQRAEFERNVNFMLLNVEYAYWNLYGAYYTLFSREQGLRYALVSWQVNKTRFDAGRIAIQDLEQTRAQYELFRAQRITAMGRVLDNERQLRGLLGLPIEDGTRIVPTDTPTLAAVQPDWASAENEALALRPELILARQDLKFRQLDLINQNNLLKPDLRFFATYDVNGIGTRLDGTATRFGGFTTDPTTGAQVPVTLPGNALGSLADNTFNNWTLGLRLDVPIGFRDAHAAVRTAQLNLKRSYFQLKDQEEKASRFLALQYRSVIQYFEEMQAQRAQREANARQLEARFKRFQVGAREETIDVLLEAQRNWADALASEYTAIVNYNNSLVGFQFAKGTIMPYDSVNISEGPLPQCVQVRAAEHFRERNLALKLRERADPAVYQFEITGANCPPGKGGGCAAPGADGPPPSLSAVPLMPSPPTPAPPATTPPPALPPAQPLTPYGAPTQPPAATAPPPTPALPEGR
jgi:outer membrane protein TolC